MIIQCAIFSTCSSIKVETFSTRFRSKSFSVFIKMLKIVFLSLILATELVKSNSPITFSVEVIVGRLDDQISTLLFRDPDVFPSKEGSPDDVWINIDLENYQIGGSYCDAHGNGDSWVYYSKLEVSIARQPQNQWKSLSIVKYTATKIPKLIFRQFDKLEKLEMTHQEVKTLTKLDFQHAENLKYLNLSHNAISYVGIHTFSSAPNLEIIDLSHNQLKDISYFAFNKLKVLQELILSRNQLTHMKPSWITPSLKSLILDHNSISHVSGTFSSDIQLESLILSYNMLTDISLFNISSEKIQHFDISNNPLNGNNEPIELKHGYTDLSETGSTFCYIGFDVVILKAKHNNISTILAKNDAFIENFLLAELLLEEVFTTNRNFDTEMVEIGDDENDYLLEELYLEHNFITTISKLSKFSKLRKIDLSYNHLERLDLETFAALNRLQEIDLSHNKIRSIDYIEFWQNTQSVEYVDISYNQMNTFELKFASPNLIELHIEGLGLTDIELTDITFMATRLQKLGLHDNNFNCVYLKNIVMLLNLEGVSVDSKFQIHDGPTSTSTPCGNDVSTVSSVMRDSLTYYSEG